MGEDSQDDVAVNPFPFDIIKIKNTQEKDGDFQELLHKSRDRRFKKENIGNTMLWTYCDPCGSRCNTTTKKRIYVPNPLQDKVLKWYHDNLYHPGIVQLYTTIHQYIFWIGLKQDVYYWVKSCPTWQNFKTTNHKQYVEVPTSDLEVILWATAHVHLFDPLTVKFKIGGEIVKENIPALTVVDAATRWPKIIIDIKKSATTLIKYLASICYVVSRSLRK